MIYTVQITSRAETDLREIYEYIAYELLSPPTAVRQLQRLEDEILSLDQMPNRYPAYLEEPWHSRGLRVMSVDNYLVFYISDAAAQPWAERAIRRRYSRRFPEDLSRHGR